MHRTGRLAVAVGAHQLLDLLHDHRERTELAQLLEGNDLAVRTGRRAGGGLAVVLGADPVAERLRDDAGQHAVALLKEGGDLRLRQGQRRVALVLWSRRDVDRRRGQSLGGRRRRDRPGTGTQARGHVRQDCLSARHVDTNLHDLQQLRKDL